MRLIYYFAIAALVLYAIIISPLLRKFTSPLLGRLSKSRRTAFVLGIVFTIFIAGFYAFMVYNRSFPMPEGWYTLFSKYILSGKVPYKDFEFLYTPGYAYLIAGIVKLFGFNILVLRIFGAILFAGLAAVLYLMLTKAFAPWISTIAACTAVFYLQSEVSNVFYDYIRVYDLFNFLTGLFLVLYVSSTANNPQARRKYIILAGLSGGLAIMIRQNSGVIVFAYSLVFLFFLALFEGNAKKRLVDALFLIGAVLLPNVILILILLSQGILSPYLEMTTAGAISAKGGMTAVLFGWIPRSMPEITSKWKSILVCLGLLGGNLLLFVKAKQKKFISHYLQSLLLLVYGAAMIMLMILSYKRVELAQFFESKVYHWLNPYSLFAVGCCIFISFGIFLIIKKKSGRSEIVNWALVVFAISGMYLATAYGSATSAGFSQGQSAFVLILLVSLLLHFSAHKFYREMLSILLVCVIAFGMSSVSIKFNHPYSWWDLAEPDIRTAKNNVDVPLLDGIYVSDGRKQVLESVYNDIIENTKDGDPIFVFPHIPIFYVMTDRYPETFTLVQWFDVASDASVIADMKFLVKNPPKVLVICKLPDYVFANHERLFRAGDKSAQRKMYKSLLKLADNGSYKLINEYDLGAGYQLVVYAQTK